MESFREPNFKLVEDLLRWLSSRFDPDIKLNGGSNDVEQRVQLIRDAAGFFLSRANIKLNGRRLYGADGWAVRELAKVTSVLRAAADVSEDDDVRRDVTLASYDVSNRLSEIKEARQLATEISSRGVLLYDLLAKEPQYKSSREAALARPLDMSAMESCIRRAVDGTREKEMATREQINSVSATESTLDSKLERRRAELQRAEKRLHTQQKIKPAYQSELSSLECELEALWEQYVLRFRCVEALKQQLSMLETAQAEAAEEQQAAIMQLITKYEAEDVLGKLSDSDDAESMSEAEPVAVRPTTRLRIKTAGGVGSERRVFGNMATRDSLDDEIDFSDDELEDKTLYTHDIDEVPSRWSRAGPRPGPARPLTRTLSQDDDYADVRGADADSLGSSSESELQVVSHNTQAHSDNEF